MKRLCLIRDICRSISEYEQEFQKEHSICLNEGMVICSLKEGKLSSGEIAKKINLTCSNTSKVIRSVEEKGFIERDMGVEDKRQMYFSLTEKGTAILSEIEAVDINLTYPLDKLVS
ncbi:MAG: winged helix DNA-binding protein [Bacteroidales bacterium]|nr:winged helix DNA-binding protein [Bacteroidales bacterium]